MKYLGFLHSCNQSQDWANSILIRVQWEDIVNAIKYGYNWKAITYGQFSTRREERGLIYPNGETYSEWARISRQYSNVFLSINFDTYPKDTRQDFIKFVTEVVNYFYLYNKNLIIGAGNETYEKRGTVNKVLEVVSDIATGVHRTTKTLPICFWNEKIRTTDEKTAAEILIKNSTIPQMCKYFGFQSLGTTPETAGKYIQLAKEKGFKVLDVELGTTTDKPNEIETLVKNDILNGVEGIWILTPEIRNKLRKEYKIWDGYALRILDDEDENFVVVNKYKRRVINYAKQFLRKEEIDDMKIKDEYKLNDSDDKVIDWIQAQLFYGGYLSKPIEFGTFDFKTELAVKVWQKDNKVVVNGKITKYHITVMIDQFVDPVTEELNPDKAFRQLVIYSS